MPINAVWKVLGVQEWKAAEVRLGRDRCDQESRPLRDLGSQDVILEEGKLGELKESSGRRETILRGGPNDMYFPLGLRVSSPGNNGAAHCLSRRGPCPTHAPLLNLGRPGQPTVRRAVFPYSIRANTVPRQAFCGLALGHSCPQARTEQVEVGSLLILPDLA